MIEYKDIKEANTLNITVEFARKIMEEKVQKWKNNNKYN